MQWEEKKLHLKGNDQEKQDFPAAKHPGADDYINGVFASESVE